MFKCLLKFGTDHIGISCIIYVIPDVQDQAQFLVGQNVLQEGESTMGFKRNETINAPFLVFTKPEICHCILYHESPSKLFACESTYLDLDPGETIDTTFRLPPFSPVVRTDFILTLIRMGEDAFVPRHV